MALPRRGRRFTAAVLSTLLIAATAQASLADSTITSITIAGSLDSEIGCTGGANNGDWLPDCAKAHLSPDAATGWWVGTFSLPGGSYQYKAAENDSWDVSYGANAGSGNANLLVPGTATDFTDVTFVFDPVSHQLGDSLSEATAVGSFDTQLGCASATPLCYQAWLRDTTGSGVLTLSTGSIAAGSYDLTVVTGFGLAGHTQSYTGSFTVPKIGGGATTVITYTLATHVVTAVSTPLVQAAAAVFSHPTARRGDVVANLFEWNWPSVANECTTVLGPAGYGAVQVAPPQDSIDVTPANPGLVHPWWEVYQAVDYHLTSRMGNEAQFKAMVAACRRAGVKVIVDAVINHMTGQGNSSYGGVTDFTHFDYPGLYTDADFHHYPQDCPINSSIADFNNVTQVQNCELVGLADLDTGSDSVRAKIAGYLNTLLSYGVYGFRVDSAKHISQADLAGIEAKLHRTVDGEKPYIVLEVAAGSPAVMAPAAYLRQGSVLGFDFATSIKAVFNSNISDFAVYGEQAGLLPSNKTLVFVQNHDSERDGTTLTYKNGTTNTLATEFMLAYGYGRPEVYSGFVFASRDDSPPSDANGFVTDTDCSGDWTCVDRSRGVANLVDWHDFAGDAPVRNFYADGVNLISFSRGNRAFIAINNEAAAQTHTFTTGLRAGVYCDIIHGTFSLDRRGASCSGPTVTVDRHGLATITVPAQDSVAFDAADLVRR